MSDQPAERKCVATTNLFGYLLPRSCEESKSIGERPHHEPDNDCERSVFTRENCIHHLPLYAPSSPDPKQEAYDPTNAQCKKLMGHAGACDPPKQETGEVALLPCPFCGSSDIEPYAGAVICNGCNSHGPIGNMAVSVLWNRRATSQRVETPRAEPIVRCARCRIVRDSVAGSQSCVLAYRHGSGAHVWDDAPETGRPVARCARCGCIQSAHIGVGDGGCLKAYGGCDNCDRYETEPVATEPTPAQPSPALTEHDDANCYCTNPKPDPPFCPACTTAGCGVDLGSVPCRVSGKPFPLSLSNASTTVTYNDAPSPEQPKAAPVWMKCTGCPLSLGACLSQRDNTGKVCCRTCMHVPGDEQPRADATERADVHYRAVESDRGIWFLWRATPVPDDGDNGGELWETIAPLDVIPFSVSNDATELTAARALLIADLVSEWQGVSCIKEIPHYLRAYASQAAQIEEQALTLRAFAHAARLTDATIRQHEETIANLNAENDRQMHRNVALRSERDAALAAVARLEQNATEWAAINETLRAERNEAIGQIDVLESRLVDAERGSAEAKRELAGTYGRSSVEKGVEDMRYQLAAAEARNTELIEDRREQGEALLESDTHNAQLTAALQFVRTETEAWRAQRLTFRDSGGVTFADTLLPAVNGALDTTTNKETS